MKYSLRLPSPDPGLSPVHLWRARPNRNWRSMRNGQRVASGSLCWRPMEPSSCGPCACWRQPHIFSPPLIFYNAYMESQILFVAPATFLSRCATRFGLFGTHSILAWKDISGSNAWGKRLRSSTRLKPISKFGIQSMGDPPEGHKLLSSFLTGRPYDISNEITATAIRDRDILPAGWSCQRN